MNYPIWYLPEIGGGTLIALIAVLHVFVSHFAVGGGLYLIFSEMKGLRENSEPLLEFTRRHAKFFLLITMVFGSISGVGIWFVIALVNPAATSYLIHNFVFGWAAEWVFFMVEIAAAFVYYYMFGKMDSRSHLQVGWLYFIAAWMSLFLINGIIGAMLTPGQWAETGDFWQGFFNPSFFPSLFFRTFVAILLAGCYGYLTASWSKDPEVKTAMTRFSALWSLVALVGAVPSAVWYLGSLPKEPLDLVLGKSPTISWAMEYGAVAIGIFLAITLLAGIIRPALNTRPMAFAAMICALVSMGAFEWVREAARRPYVINQVVYSNSIFKKDIGILSQDGYLASALWVTHRELTDDNRLEAGKELFIHQCYGCHTLGGRNNDLVELTGNMSYRALTSYIGKIHTLRYFMPPFAGTEEEAEALAAFIVSGIHGKTIEEPGVADSPADPGGLLFEQHCAACHETVEMTDLFAGMEPAEISPMLRGLDEISEEMEPFVGTDTELNSLATYLSGGGVSEGNAPIDGGLVFETNCSSCHEAEDVFLALEGSSNKEIVTVLATLDEISDEMIPFEGDAAEAEALADFINGLQGGN